MTKEEQQDSCVTPLRNKLDAALEGNRSLEEENEVLKQEVMRLRAQVASLRAQDADRRSILWQKLQNPVRSDTASQEKQMLHNDDDSSLSKAKLYESPATTKERAPRVPNPPPKPMTYLPLTPKISGKEASFPPPPPPPPPPAKLLGRSTRNVVKRVPEVVELYRALTRKDRKQETRTSIPGTPLITNSREMIGEIENRSAYLLAIKSDVETQGEFINFLVKEVENATYKDISDVEAFVKWLDGELSYLVDERAVLKHFPQWPERKADAMREAAFSYRDLEALKSEVLSFHDDTRQPTLVALKRMRALQDKLECGVHNLERVRESACKRYRDFQIPWEWMLDSGIIAELKSGSMRLAKEYMNRVVTALQSDASSEDEDVVVQGARFAFRVHQFVGGFDGESRRAFQELRKLADKHLL